MRFRKPSIQLPMCRRYIGSLKKFAFEFRFLLDIRAPAGGFTALPFLLDTGADFMCIPQRLAAQPGIEFSTDCPLSLITLAGPTTEPSFLSPVYYSFPQLPNLEFKVDCVFSPREDLPFGLFTLTDFVPHFVVRSNKESPQFPEGSVVFQLRNDHQGSKRA